jgi:hypothetical protein
MILFMPSALIRRLGFAGSGIEGGSDSPRILAHRSRCASFIRFRTAALRFLPLRAGTSGVAAGSTSAAFIPPLRTAGARTGDAGAGIPSNTLQRSEGAVYSRLLAFQLVDDAVQAVCH